MNKNPLVLAALLLSASLAHAMPTQWQLFNESMDLMGTFQLDIDTQTTSDADLNGESAHYTISSRTFLNTNDFVGPFRVNNYINFFSTLSGTEFREDYGGGEYYEQKINEAAIEIGTMTGVLEPGGGTYAAYINEIYNYDESYVSCLYYEELYDPITGDYIGDGDCLDFDSINYFNVDESYWYPGFLRSAPVTSEVPILPTVWLTLIGLVGLGWTKTKRG